MSIFWNIIVYSLLAGLAAIFGVYLVRIFGGWTKRNSVLIISFAAGLLLANAFLHLLPEAAALSIGWPYWILAAVIVFYLIEHIIIIHCCTEQSCEVHTVGTTSLIGIGLHSLIDGIIISVAFQAGFVVGLATSLAVIFHKIADGVCVYGLLIHDEVSRSRAFFYSMLVALATPLGAIAAGFFLNGVSAEIEGGLLAAAAGSLIYIGASDLVPATHKKQSFKNIILFLLGIVFVVAVGYLERGI